MVVMDFSGGVSLGLGVRVFKPAAVGKDWHLPFCVRDAVLLFACLQLLSFVLLHLSIQ